MLAVCAAAPLLAGCSLLEGPTPTTPEREAPEKPEVVPQLVPGGSAEENLPYFTEVLRGYAEGESPIKAEPVVNAVAEAGFDKALMQVSFDSTKTGLEADNIFVSVRIDADCLVGQLVAADRSFVAENQPAVGPNNDICLIGETNPITW